MSILGALIGFRTPYAVKVKFLNADDERCMKVYTIMARDSAEAARQIEARVARQFGGPVTFVNVAPVLSTPTEVH